MQFFELSGAELLQLADDDEISSLHAAGVHDRSQVRINLQGDIEVLQDGVWSVIGGLLGDYKARIKKLTGRQWS